MSCDVAVICSLCIPSLLHFAIQSGNGTREAKMVFSWDFHPNYTLGIAGIFLEMVGLEILSFASSQERLGWHSRSFGTVR